MDRLLGLIGGVSPESTPIYYAQLNDAARAERGGAHSMPLLIYTLDFGVMQDLYAAADWRGYEAQVAGAADRLKAGGATALAICSNTSHIGADAARAATGLPVVHILDALAEALKEGGAKRPLLLGTPFVMEGGFYLPELNKRFDGDVQVPADADRETVGRIIFTELAKGIVAEASRAAIRTIVEKAVSDGADAVILGCTELCMILSDDDVDAPVYDTTALHAAAAARYALGRD
ncbi:MAG: amino acid racemase [Pseudomonadota bacterium]